MKRTDQRAGQDRSLSEADCSAVKGSRVGKARDECRALLSVFGARAWETWDDVVATLMDPAGLRLRTALTAATQGKKTARRKRGRLRG